MNSKAECCAQLHPDKQAMCLRWSARGTAGVCLLPLRAAQCLGARLTAPSANPVSWGPHSFARVEVREADGEAGERLPLARQRDVGPGVRGQDIERVLPGLHALPALANRQVGEVGVQGAQRDLVPRRESPQPQRGLYGSHDGGRHLAEQGAAVLWPVGEDVVPHGAVAFFDPKHCRLGRDVVIVEARGSKGEKEVPWGAQVRLCLEGALLGLGLLRLDHLIAPHGLGKVLVLDPVWTRAVLLLGANIEYLLNNVIRRVHLQPLLESFLHLHLVSGRQRMSLLLILVPEPILALVVPHLLHVSEPLSFALMKLAL
mmetsp:Transcript_2992/g.6828  ORF Transcript_2992/g.6828 Transcript_2992/m.6828 type:complete len:315 (-) Transcript_2992:39-983(-)